MSLSPPVCLFTHTVPFFLLMITLLVSLLSVFVGIIFAKLKNQGVVTDPWSNG